MEKITFLGNFRVDYTTETHYLKTFRKLEVEVHTIQESDGLTQEDITHALNSDMFFWVHTHGWETHGLDQLLLDLKAKKIPVVGYHLDLWLGIEREKDLHNDSYWSTMDYFFSVDALMVNWLNERQERGEKFPRAFFLPAGVLEEDCYCGDFRKEYAHDVIFVGSRNYHAEWHYRVELIEFLEKTYGDRFKLYEHSNIPKMRGKELNDLYASAKVVVGDTLCKDFTYPYYSSDRLFETTGRGGMLVYPYIKGLEDWFNTMRNYNSIAMKDWVELMEDPRSISIHDEVVFYSFGHFEELKNKINLLLANDTLRKSIQTAGQKRTKADHTYTNRLQYILKTIQDENSNS